MKDKTEYLLSCLAEECAEVIKVIHKIDRFGVEGQREDGIPNNVRLSEELVDIFVIVDLLKEEGFDFPTIDDDEAYLAKEERLNWAMGVSRQLGLLEKD